MLLGALQWLPAFLSREAHEGWSAHAQPPHAYIEPSVNWWIIFPLGCYQTIHEVGLHILFSQKVIVKKDILEKQSVLIKKIYF